MACLNGIAAFRCKTCGHLEDSGHAGENAVPASCSACGAGISFTPKGVKSFDTNNWEVLADAATERLAELGLTSEQVERHAGKTDEPPVGASISVSAGDAVVSENQPSG